MLFIHHILISALPVVWLFNICSFYLLFASNENIIMFMCVCICYTSLGNQSNRSWRRVVTQKLNRNMVIMNSILLVFATILCLLMRPTASTCAECEYYDGARNIITLVVLKSQCTIHYCQSYLQRHKIVINMEFNLLDNTMIEIDNNYQIKWHTRDSIILFGVQKWLVSKLTPFGRVTKWSDTPISLLSYQTLFVENAN